MTTFKNLTLAGGNLLGKGGFNAAWGSFALLGTLSVTADSSILSVSGANNSISPGEFNNNQTLNINVSAGATLTENLPLRDYPFTPTKVYSMTKAGLGTAVISGTNTYSGGTTLQAGTLAIAAYTNLPTVGALTFTGGILRVTGTALTNLNPYPLIWSSKGGGFDVATGGNTLAVTNALGGGGGLLKLGAGALTLVGANTYSGDTTNSAGLLRLAHPSAVSNSTVVMDGGACVFATSTGTNITFGGLAAAGSGAGYDIGLTNDAGNAVTLTVGNNASNTVYAGVLSGSGSLVKVGTGRLTLAGTNTYTGATIVSAGTLVATNMSVLGASPNITLALGANLAFASGGETFNGALTVNVSSNSASLLTVNGNLTLGAGSSLTVAAGSQFNRQKSYTVVTCTALSGAFGSVNGLPKYWCVRYLADRVELFYAEGTLIRLH